VTLGSQELSDIERLEEEVNQAALGQAVKSDIIPSLFQLLINTDAQPSPISGAQSRSDFIDTKPDTGFKTDIGSVDQVNPAISPLDSTANVVLHSPHWVGPDVFADMVLHDDENFASDRIRLIQAEGVPDEDILLELLAPTSLELGVRWENDTCDFADVTIGVCRLHRIVRSLHPQHQRELLSNAHGGRIVLAPAPGDQHSFGLLLVSELLFRHGWYTDIEIGDRSPQITNMVAKEWYEMAGISISCETRINDAAALISQIRSASCNPDIAILAGGPIFANNPEAGKNLKADKIALPGVNLATLTKPYIPTSQRNSVT
jgi:methanogenic corrinoid protein MtbC1